MRAAVGARVGSLSDVTTLRAHHFFYPKDSIHTHLAQQQRSSTIISPPTATHRRLQTECICSERPIPHDRVRLIFPFLSCASLPPRTRFTHVPASTVIKPQHGSNPDPTLLVLGDQAAPDWTQGVPRGRRRSGDSRAGGTLCSPSHQRRAAYRAVGQ
jgi:hypothetical protein